jgi:hypothetical protein
MNMSTTRGRHCIRPAFIWLAETGLFRQFQYLTVPLHTSPGFMNAYAHITRGSRSVLPEAGFE